MVTTATRPAPTGAPDVSAPVPVVPPDATAPGAPVPDEPALDFPPIAIRLPDAVVAAGSDACEEWFWAVCSANQDSFWAMELTADGALELMPSYAYSERREFRAGFALETWNISRGSPGMTTGPSAAYLLPNGAIRGPDAAWTLAENITPPSAVPPRTWPFCPDFVIEIASAAPALPGLLNKMAEYMDNGAQLGWLIDPLERTVRIYRAGVSEPELLHNPETLDGADVLPGFTFPVRHLIFDLA